MIEWFSTDSPSLRRSASDVRIGRSEGLRNASLRCSPGHRRCFFIAQALSLVLSFVAMTTWGTPDAMAQDASHRSVEIEHKSPLNNRGSIAQARQRAIQGAHAEAIRQVVGTRVQANEQYLISSSGTDRRESFTQTIRTETRGRVVESVVLDEGVVGEVGHLNYLIRVRVTVAKEHGVHDPSFRVHMTLSDKDRVFLSRSKPGSRSDEMIVYFKTTQDAYLTLFHVQSDTVQVLWPNSLDQNTFVRAGTSAEFPTPEMRRRKVRLRTQLPANTDRSVEQLVAVATKRRMSFTNPSEPSFDDDRVVLESYSINALNQWLVGIPLDQRDVAEITYEVREAGP